MRLSRLITLGLLGLGWAGAAAAQAPPPIGTWVGTGGGVLMVFPNATCGYIVPAARVQGRCEWMGNSTGGVLTIHYLTPTVTQTFQNQLYFNISWVNQGTITVFGEVFRRRQ